MKLRVLSLIALFCGLLVIAYAAGPSGDAALGTLVYDDFEPNEVCAECHVDIARQYEQALMHVDSDRYGSLVGGTVKSNKGPLRLQESVEGV
ncbi:MAG: hypothetical protein ACC742_07610 [Thermoanaerobaculales bacterium]